MKRKITTILLTGALLFMALGIFTGCSNTREIRDFDKLSDLPSNPDRVVFLTDFGEGEMYEFEVPQEDISYVMEILFARTYRRGSRNIAIDVQNNFLRIIKGDSTWEFNIGIIYQGGRWYEPTQEDNLRTFLFSLADSYRGQ